MQWSTGVCLQAKCINSSEAHLVLPTYVFQVDLMGHNLTQCHWHRFVAAGQTLHTPCVCDRLVRSEIACVCACCVKVNHRSVVRHTASRIAGCNDPNLTLLVLCKHVCTQLLHRKCIAACQGARAQGATSLPSLVVQVHQIVQEALGEVRPSLHHM